MNDELICPICMFLSLLLVCTFDWTTKRLDRLWSWLLFLPKPASPPATNYVDTNHCDGLHEDWLNGDSDEFDVELDGEESWECEGCDGDPDDCDCDNEFSIEESIKDLDAIVWNYTGEPNEIELLEAALREAEGWKVRLGELKGEVYVG